MVISYCPSCGDEITETEFQATGSCYYCNRAEQIVDIIKEDNNVKN